MLASAASSCLAVRPAAGWTLYAPLTLQHGPVDGRSASSLMHIIGASSIMGSINIIVTILNMRAPGMTLMKMPMFVLDLADHRLPADRRHAGAGRRHDDDADRPSLRHELLQRRPVAVTRSCTSTCSGSSVTPRCTS
jgi:hypothetical protein